MNILSTSSINSLINNYKLSERYKTIKPLETRKSKFSNLSKTWNSLSSKLTSLKSMLINLKDNSAGKTFDSKTVELSTADYFDASATSSASLSSYNVFIKQLAQNDVVMSDTKTAESSAGLSAGTYTFKISSGSFDKNIDIIVEGTETVKEVMEKIADAINNDEESNVKASIFAPKDGEAKLSVVAGNSGQNNAITINDVSGNVLGSIGMNFSSRTLANGNSGGYSHSLSELNAKLSLNGIDVERASNVIDDLISGVTLTLKKSMDEGVPKVNLIVKNNMEAIKSDIEDFIKKFNDVYTYVKQNSKTTQDGDRGIFVGNNSARALMQTFAKTAYAQVEGLPDGKLSYLNEIGITFDSEKGLSISDSSKLEDALKNKSEEVSNLFASDNGIATKLFDTVERYIGNNGLITTLTDSYDKSVTYLKERITSKEKQIDKGASSLRHEYETLQNQLAILLQANQDYQTMGGLLQ